MVDERTLNENAKLVEVYSAAHEIEAKMVVNALASEKIEALMQGQHSASFRAEVPSDVKVVVHKIDAEAARGVIERLKLDDEIDWDQIDVGSPTD